MYNQVLETRDIILSDGGLISFNNKFIYLRLIINFLLDDIEDVMNQINKVSKSIGILKFVWDTKDVLLETKIKLYTLILLNLLLWDKDN